MAESNTDRILTFEVYRGAALIKSAEYTQESVTIGSGSSAVLSIPDKTVSELHAVVNIDENGRLQILDLGSDSGTSVNGEPISSYELRSGDKIEMGDIAITITSSGDDEFDDEEATMVADHMAILQQAQLRQHNLAKMHEEDVTDPNMGNDGALIDKQHVEGDEAEDIDEEDEEALPENQIEDVMAFIMRSGTAQSNIGIDKKRPKVLEVNQMWEDVLLDTKHFPKNGKPVTIGSSVGWRWNFLGIDLGWVPAPLHLLVGYAPPVWSDVTSDWRNDFYTPDENLPDGKDHDLFRWEDGHYVAKVAENWDGFVDIGEKRYNWEELEKEGKAKKQGKSLLIPMEDDERLMVDVDGVVLFAHMVFPGRRVLQRMSENVDYPFIAIFTLVGFVGLMFGVLMYTLPPPPKNEMVEIPDRFVELLLEKPEIEQRKKDKPSGNPDAGEGAKAKREEGKVGKKDAKMEKAKGTKVEVQKQQLDRKIAENAGVLGALRDGAELDGVFGSSGLSSDITGGIGGLIGAKGTQIGSGGLGSRGSGLGGGGTAEGLGGLGTKGVGSGASGYGSGGGHFGEKGDGAIGTVGGDPIILGALDRSLIDEVIKRHMNQIRYCYQRELTKDPSLSGKIVIKFVIAKDGSVSTASVKSSTMGNSAVETCVTGRFMRMQFPQPKGGGIVIVSYPFLFSPG